MMESSILKKTFYSHGNLSQRKERDQIKNNYCKENGICLIRIPYTNFDKLNKEYLLERINNV